MPISPEQLKSLSQQLEAIKQQALKIKEQVTPLVEAEKAGLKITPQTTVEQAQQFLKTGVVPTPTFIAAPPIGTVDATVFEELRSLRKQIQEREAREAELQKQFISTLEPTEEEKRLQEELLATRQAERTGEVAIQAQPIPQPLIGKQVEKLREQIQLREMPLIEQLRLETEKRQSAAEKIRAMLGFETAGIERALGLEREFRDLTRQQRQDARQLLESTLGKLEGFAFEDLDTESQKNLTALVNSVNPDILPIIKEGMRKGKEIIEAKIPGALREEIVGGFRVLRDEKGNIISAREADTGLSVPRLKAEIISDINSAVDQYKINPEGFRERFVERLVDIYGKENRDFITRQVYTLMPDIPSKRRFLSQEWFIASFNEDSLSAEATKAGFGRGLFGSKKDQINRYLTSVMQTVESYRNAGFSDEDILKFMRK